MARALYVSLWLRTGQFYPAITEKLHWIWAMIRLLQCQWWNPKEYIYICIKHMAQKKWCFKGSKAKQNRVHIWSNILYWSFLRMRQMVVGNKNLRMERCIIDVHMSPLNGIQLVWEAVRLVRASFLILWLPEVCIMKYFVLSRLIQV